MRLPAGNLAVRLGLLGSGILILVWLPVEDGSTNAAQAIGTAAGTLAALRVIPVGLRQTALGRLAAGLIAGLLASPTAAGLMVLKMGIHAHAISEYSLLDFQVVLGRTPVFALGGLLVAAGVHFILESHAA